MLTALEIVALLALIVLSACAVLHAVRSRQTSSDAFLMLDRAHERWVKHTEDLHNRLMAKDWGQYIELKTFSEEDTGGFQTPEEQKEDEDDDEVTQLIPNGWGGLKNLMRDIPRPSADEERLLAEDFDEDGDAVTDQERRYAQAKDRGVV